MRKVIHRLWFVWDFDREEIWLNSMAAKGLALVATGFCRYEFEASLPGEYSVRLQLLEHKPFHPESEQYLTFLEETGVEHVGSWLRWVYLRKKTADGSFELFSDNDSKIKQLSLIITMLLFLSIANLFCGVNNVILMFLNRMAISAVGFFNLALGIAGCLGCRRLCRKRRVLKKDQQVFQ